MVRGCFDPNNYPERFRSKIHFSDTCWLWKARKTNYGYGEYSSNGRSMLSHRFSWSFVNIEDLRRLNHDRQTKVAEMD